MRHAPERGLHVHLIEPVPLGHGPLWLRYLVAALAPCVAQLTLTYPDTAAYAGLGRLAAEWPGQLELRPRAWQRGRDSWRPMFDGARQTGAGLTLVTWLDALLRDRIAGDPGDLCGSPVWGLWFCPAPRRALSRWDPRWLVSRRYRRRCREQQLLAEPPPWLAGAWLSDPLLAARVSARPGLQLNWLPDPWPTRPVTPRAEARARLGLPQDKRIFLHVGVHDARKGLLDAAQAWDELGDLPDALLLRAGVTTPAQAAALAPLVQAGRALVHEGLVAEERMDSYLRACDWVLLPYRYHEGSSGLLAGAAAANRPVISADHGVVGQRVAESALGLVYPHLSVDGLAGAVRQACRLPPGGFDAGLARYAASHRPEDFIAAVRGPLGLAPRGSAPAQPARG